MARKDLPSPNAPNFPPRVREELHALMGKLGNPGDRALTLRDAIESGVIATGPGGSLIPGPGAGAAEEPDLTPPPQPGAFTATGAISHFLISQAQPFYTQGHGHNRTVVYGAQWASGPLPVFADAVELDRFAGTVRAVASNPATTWRLWIKWESLDGVLSATPSGGTNGVAVTTGQDVALLLDALAGQITALELASSLSTPIGQIPSISSTAAAALAQANANLAAIGTIQTELAELSGTPDYSAGTTYALDDIVKYSGGLYRALGTTTGNLPTNTAFWQKIGDYASLGDAVSAHAAQLSDHETRITANEGELTAQASDITQLQSDISTTNAAVATKASASALSALDTRVTAAEGVNTSQGAAITNLQNSVTTLNDGLATKADATALTALTTRVTAAEGVNTSQGSSITILSNSLTTVDGLLRINDTRDDNRDPSWYVTNYPRRSVVEFKSRTAIGAPGTQFYGDLRTTVRWLDLSGGPVTQVFSTGDSLQTYSRFSTSGTTWSAWKNDVLDLTTVVETKASASALNALDTRVTAAEGTISSQGSSITLLQNDISTLTTTVGTKASASALSALDTRVTSAEGVNTSQATAITGLQSSVTTLSNGLATKADASALTETNTNVSNLAGTVSAQAGQITAVQSRVARSVNYRIAARGADAGIPAGGMNYGVRAEDGTSVYLGSRSYMLVVLNGSTGAVVSSQFYDVFGNGAIASGRGAAALAADLNALTADRVVVVYTYDEPRANRLTGGLEAAMYRCGASRSVFGAPDSAFRSRSAYILVGIPGIGEGAGIERYAGATDGDPLAYCEYSLQLVNGRPVGMGGNPLNATVQTEISTRATQTGELYAQYTVKTDVGGLVSGYGLASSANNAAPTSAFGVQAGQFFVAPPAVAAATAPTAGLFKGYAWRDTTANVTKYWTGSAWSTSPQALPFVVQAVPQTINGFTVEPGIYADAAFFARLVATRGQIGLLAVDDARIADLSVSKLTAGSIAVGQFAQSTGYVAGSAGWRINGDGTAEFSGVVVRGTIFASQGAIGGWNIGSNYLQSTTYVLGESGTRLNSDGTGQIGGVRITANTVESHNFDSPTEPFGFRLRNNGANEFKGGLIRNGAGKVLLTAVGDAVPPWVTTLQQANDAGISLVSDPDPATNTARIKSLFAGYLTDIDTTDEAVTISAIPPTIATRIDQTQNSTTWADVQGVSWPVEADTYYEFDAFAFANPSTTSGRVWDVGFVFPSGTVASGASLQTFLSGAARGAMLVETNTLDASTRLVFQAAQSVADGPLSVGHTQTIKGLFYTGSTAGVVQVQFRRASGSGSNVLRRGSIFKLRKTNIAPELGTLASPQTIPTTALSATTSTYSTTPGIKLEVLADGTWKLTRNGTTTLTGNWLQGAPVTAGQAQNYDVLFEVSPRVLGGTGPSATVKTSFTAATWTQITSTKKADVWMDVSSVGAAAGTRTCSFTITTKVRNRSSQVVTTIGTTDCALTGTATQAYDFNYGGGGD